MKVKIGYAKTHAQAKQLFVDMNHNEVPEVYRLDVTQLRLVDKYLDETGQWIQLVDGQRVRTRTFKRNWEAYIPVDFKERAKSNDYAFTKHLNMTRVLTADHHCKHRIGTLRLWCEGKVAFIEHTAHEVVSLLTYEITTPDLATALVDVLRKYQIACRYFTKRHDLNVKLFLESLKHLHDLSESTKNYQK